MSAPSPKVLVIGASGGTGRAVVSELQARKIPCRLFLRDTSLVPLNSDVFQGDALTSDLLPAFDGITSVISTLGSREPDGLRNVDLPATIRLVTAARKCAVSRFVLCSTIGAVPTPGIPEHLLKAFAPKGEAEKFLQDSGLSYTIVRPGRLYDELVEDPRGIERASVAKALVESLERQDAINRIYELSQARLAAPGADPVLGLRWTDESVSK